MSAYYNEIDTYAAQWLRNLIAAGHIAPGDVDERSIVDVQPDDLRGYTQCHFFAGIGGWSYALRLAGWPDDRPVWTGSCPCQPFSSAGKGECFDDPRHLWPSWFRLIRECAPPVVFGEQVASAAGWAWADHVATDLEGVAYAFGAADVPAAGVGAWHIRQRLWWVADSESCHGRLPVCERGSQQESVESLGRGEVGELGHADDARSQGRVGAVVSERTSQRAARASSNAGIWTDAEWISCRDGKARPTEPGLFPLAHGVSGRVGRLRAYGNAIVPQVAAEFIGAYLDVVDGTAIGIDQGETMTRTWDESMGEISGFGGGYEAVCRAMVLAGITWLDEHTDADPQFHGYKGVYGVIEDDNEDAKALTKAIMDAPVPGVQARAGDDCTGAMHHAAVSHCLAYRRLGWDEYRRQLQEREQDEKGA